VGLRSKESPLPAQLTSSVFTISGFGEYLKISKSTPYKLAREGSIPGRKVGKQWRFRKDAVDDWLRQRGPSRGTE
jgi:excisionase family DNA binding protein